VFFVEEGDIHHPFGSGQIALRYAQESARGFSRGHAWSSLAEKSSSSI
jgi:hypothetical protein